MASRIVTAVYPLAFALLFPFAVSATIVTPTQFFRHTRGRS
jgi:hypothetical protein